MSRKRIALTVVAGVAVAAALVVAGLAGASTKARSHVSAVSGSVSFDGIWTSSTGQKQFADVIKAFNKVFPKVKINYKTGLPSTPNVLLCKATATGTGTVACNGHIPTGGSQGARGAHAIVAKGTVSMRKATTTFTRT